MTVMHNTHGLEIFSSNEMKNLEKAVDGAIAAGIQASILLIIGAKLPAQVKVEESPSFS